MEEPVYCCKLYTTQYKSWSLKLMVFGSSKNLIVANSIILVAEARWAWLLTRIGGVGGRRKRSRANSRGVAAAGMHCMRMPHLPSGGRLSKGNQNSKSSTFNSPLFLPQSSPILNCQWLPAPILIGVSHLASNQIPSPCRSHLEHSSHHHDFSFLVFL